MCQSFNAKQQKKLVASNDVFSNYKFEDVTQVKSRNMLRFEYDPKSSQCSSAQDYSAPAISPILKGRDRLLSVSNKKRNGIMALQKSYQTELNSDVKMGNHDFRLNQMNSNNYRSEQKDKSKT